MHRHTLTLLTSPRSSLARPLHALWIHPRDLFGFYFTVQSERKLQLDKKQVIKYSYEQMNRENTNEREKECVHLMLCFRQDMHLLELFVLLNYL